MWTAQPNLGDSKVTVSWFSGTVEHEKLPDIFLLAV